MDWPHIVEILLTGITSLVFRELVGIRKQSEKTHARVNEFTIAYAGDRVERDRLRIDVDDHERRLRHFEEKA